MKAEFYHLFNIMDKVARAQILAASHSTRPKRYPMKLPREYFKKSWRNYFCK